MEPQSSNAPIVVIVGQTASGKSALALELAERWNGEIIAADSRTVYRGMDIGTAKPTPAERQRIPHHLIDIRNVDESFTASDFQYLAKQTIEDIAQRRKVPIIAGGTGLYIDALLYDFGFRGAPDPERRAFLESISVDELQYMLHEEGIPLPANERNPRHLIRAIESGGMPASRGALRSQTLLIGLDLDKELLERRIIDRTDAMLVSGLETEAREMTKRYGWSCPPLQTIGYQEFRPYFTGEVTLQEVRQTIIVHTRQLAKRQKTWFRRNKSIHWISKTEEAVDIATTFLNK